MAMNQVAPQPRPKDDLVGRVINDRFRIVSVIARGGMGRVYRAEQVPLGRMVALKTLDPRTSGGDTDPQFQQRFFLEASVASKLQHPNTVTVFDYGRTADGIFFIAMELVEGRSLFRLIREEGPFSAGRVIHVALQIARSLREAHRLEVIHRDLKPANILLTRHGDEEDFVKVLDFGLVKHVETPSEQELTKAGLFMGSPKYMSPEQIRGERVDPRADIYSLGVVMYEMLVGKVPFDGENAVKVLMAHMHETAAPIDHPDCPLALSELIMRCLAKRPEARPTSMDDVILMLKQATGISLTTSGAFALSQELRLAATPSTVAQLPAGTPAQPFVAATLSGEPSQALALSGAHPQLAVPSMAPTSPQAPPGGSRLAKFVAIGAMLIAAGFLVLRFTEQLPGLGAVAPQKAPQPLPEPATRPEAEPAGAGATAAEEAAPPEQHRVLVSLNTAPPGARVTIEGKDYGRTPASIEWYGEQAEPGREVTFLFEKEGFEKVTVVRTVTTEELAIDARLPRAARRRTASAARRSAPRKPAPPPAEPVVPVVVPDNFKDDPY